MNRREFLRTAGGAAGTAAATSAVSGSAAAQEGTSSGGGSGGGSGPIDYGGYLSDAKGWGGSGSTVDKTGKKKVTIKVGSGSGGMAFKPAGVHVDPGTKVVWKWVDASAGPHNVVGENKDFKSGSPKSKGTYSKTFKKKGIVKYYCSPHQSSGMLGAVAVGSVPHKSAAAAHAVKPEEMGVPIQPHYVGFGAGLAMTTSLLFTFYLLKYGESAHTKGGNN